jgi:hypothetical protein
MLRYLDETLKILIFPVAALDMKGQGVEAF